MHGHHLSFSELLSTCSVGSQGKLSLFKLVQFWHLSCLSRRLYSLSRRYYLFGRIPGGGCAAKCARIRFCCMGEVFALLGDAKHSQGRPNTIQYNDPVSLSASLPTVVVQSNNLVVLRKTSDFPCNTSWGVQTAKVWTRFFS